MPQKNILSCLSYFSLCAFPLLFMVWTTILLCLTLKRLQTIVCPPKLICNTLFIITIPVSLHLLVPLFFAPHIIIWTTEAAGIVAASENWTFNYIMKPPSEPFQDDWLPLCPQSSRHGDETPADNFILWNCSNESDREIQPNPLHEYQRYSFNQHKVMDIILHIQRKEEL